MLTDTQPPAYPPEPSPPAQPEPSQAAPSRTRFWTVFGIVAAGFLLMAVALFLTGQLGRFLTVGVEIVPLAALATVAYGERRNPGLGVLTYVMFAVVTAAILFNALANVLVPFMQTGLLSAGGAASGASLSDILKPGAGPALLWTVLLLVLVTLVALTMFLRPVRVLMARVLPVDPDNFVHKIALATLTLLLLSSFVPLIALAGSPPLLLAIQNGSLGTTVGEEPLVGPLDLIFQFVWTIPAVIFAAGWPVARKFGQTLARLGMVRPTAAQVLFGVVFGVLFAVFAAFVLDPGINWLWQTLGWKTTNTSVFGDLMKGVTTPVGAVLVGVTAGIGEEMAVRGLLQPRIGLIFSNLVFTSLHAFQYGLDALLSVFIIGLVLGIIRARTNTSTSAIVHGVYDFVLVLWAALSLQVGS